MEYQYVSNSGGWTTEKSRLGCQARLNFHSNCHLKLSFNGKLTLTTLGNFRLIIHIECIFF